MPELRQFGLRWVSAANSVRLGLLSSLRPASAFLIMSEFKFTCPHCGEHILCDALWSGREIKCPACQHVLVVAPPPSEADALPVAVKLQATIGAERFVSPLAVIGLVVCVIGLKLGPGRKCLGVVSAETSLLIGLGIGGAILLSAALLWFLVDNYYVFCRPHRRVLLHKGLRFFGSEVPYLEGDNITAVGLDCAPINGKGGQKGWSYTPVLLLRDSSAIKLASLRTNMKCQELPDYNRRTRLWAAALQCYWVECPPNQVFKVKDHLAKFEPALNQTPQREVNGSA